MDRPPPKEKEKKKPRGLKRNEACQSCRNRKLRCDAVRPACATCIRSYNHAMEHLKPNKPPPVYPVCNYEPEITSPDQEETKPKPSQSKTATPRQDWPTQPKLVPANTSTHPPPTQNYRPLLPASGYASSTSSASSPQPFASSSTSYQPSYQPPPPQQQSFAGQTTYQPILPHPPPPASFQPQTSYAPSNSTPFNPQHSNYQAYSNGFSNGNGDGNGQYAVEIDQERRGSGKRPRLDEPVTEYEVQQPQLPQGEQLQGFFAELGVDLGGLGPGLDGLDGQGGAGGETDGFLFSLLWPGWPEHLPPPGKLEHLVNNFFKFSPFANQILNQGRFMARLALPPTHQNFPHPSLLHAICASTARFVGGLALVPPSATLFVHSPVAEASKNRLPGQPAWDGLTNRPAAVTKGVDEDFGQVHASWAQLYIDQARHHPEQWLEATQALLFLTYYNHQHGLWLKAWSAVGSMVRLSIPLGLNAPLPAGALGRTKPVVGRVRQNLLGTPMDEIERIERQNLFWLVLCLDTYASASTQLQGAYETTNIRIPFPTSLATVPPNRPPRPPSQFGDSPDIIYSHHPPEHSNSFALHVKGSLLLRRVVDFVRTTKKDGHDPRGKAEFVELDALITAFKESIPSGESFAVLQQDGMAVDRDLVVAQALPEIARLHLHDPFFDDTDPSDPSIPLVRASLSAMVQQCHVLFRSNFDFALLLPFMTHAWFSASKCLLRFLTVAVQASDIQQAQALLGDIGIFRTAITRVAERLPLGARQCIMLDNLLTEVISSPACQAMFPPDPSAGAGGVGNGSMGGSWLG